MFTERPPCGAGVSVSGSLLEPGSALKDEDRWGGRKWPEDYAGKSIGFETKELGPSSHFHHSLPERLPSL